MVSREGPAAAVEAHSAAMKQVLKVLKRAAPRAMPVWLWGPSGVGK